MAVNPDEHCRLRVQMVEVVGKPAGERARRVSKAIEAAETRRKRTGELSHSRNRRSSTGRENVADLDLLHDVVRSAGSLDRRLENRDEHFLGAGVAETPLLRSGEGRSDRGADYDIRIVFHEERRLGDLGGDLRGDGGDSIVGRHFSKRGGRKERGSCSKKFQVAGYF